MHIAAHVEECLARRVALRFSFEHRSLEGFGYHVWLKLFSILGWPVVLPGRLFLIEGCGQHIINTFSSLGAERCQFLRGFSHNTSEFLGSIQPIELPLVMELIRMGEARAVLELDPTELMANIPVCFESHTTNLLRAFEYAALIGDAFSLRMLLKDCGSQLDISSPFFLACCGCSTIFHCEEVVEIVATLLEKVHVVQNLEHPMFVACCHGKGLLVKQFLRLGVEADGTYRGTSFLNMASLYGHLEVVTWLLDGGARDLQAALFDACSMGHGEIVERLISAGADVNGQERFGGTPLGAAVLASQLNVVRLLLGHGADPNATDHLLSDALGFPEILKLLLENGLAPDKSTVLRKALQEKAPVKVFQLLLDYGAKLQPDLLGEAAFKGRSDAVDFLLAHGANVAAVNSSGVTALEMACSSPSYMEGTIRRLLDPSFSERKLKESFELALRNRKDAIAVEFLSLELVADVCFRHALQSSIEANLDQLFQFCLSQDATLVTAVLNSSKETALLVASRFGRFKHLTALVALGADVRAKDWDGLNALSLASSTQCVGALLDAACPILPSDSGPLTSYADRGLDAQMEFLLSRRGSDFAVHSGSDICNAASVSAGKGYVRCLRVLLSHIPCCVCFPGVFGARALSSAAGGGCLRAIELILAVEGVEVDEEDILQRTPLIYAVKENHLQVAKLLLERGADPHHLDGFEKSPLHYAVKLPQPAMVVLLTNHGADIAAVDGQGRSFLMIACYYAAIAVVEALVKNPSVDIRSKDSTGRTAFDMALESEKELPAELMDMLLPDDDDDE